MSRLMFFFVVRKGGLEEGEGSPLPPIAGSAHVPKVGVATNVKQLRPILNCSFKILSKLQTYRWPVAVHPETMREV